MVKYFNEGKPSNLTEHLIVQDMKASVAWIQESWTIWTAGILLFETRQPNGETLQNESYKRFLM